VPICYQKEDCYIRVRNSSKDIAEELLQETFLRIWKSIDNLINIKQED
jgi:DNA-directed RNA polymerase specialized sigma24 family protein